MTRRTPNCMHTNQKTILVVEDHATIQGLLMDAFTLNGYQCSCVPVEDVISLNWIEESVHLAPTGIILDIDADIRSAFQGPSDFLHTICMQWQTASLTEMPPILLLTALPERRDECEREGYTVLQKPFKPQSILEQMKRAIEQKQRGDAPRCL